MLFRSYCHRADIPQNVSTLSLDFVLFSREAWREAGKFDEELFFPAREVDFFARMRECGYDVVVDSKLKVICRRDGKTDYQIKPEEFSKLQKRWEEGWRRGDLAYNPNLWEGDANFTFHRH